MPDNWRFSEEDLEQSLKDLGARVEYPPTPDLAHTVRRELDEEEQPREARRTLRWPPFLAPRWTAVAAVLVLIAIVALSPAMRTTLSGFFSPQTGLEAGGSAAKPGGAGSEDRYKQEAGVASQEDAAAPAAGAPEANTACPSPSIQAVPARAAAGSKFRLRGQNFSSGCDRTTPARGIEIFFRQDGKTIRLATLDAGRDLAFDTRLRVPQNARPGRATLLTNTRSGEPEKERFVVLP
jgi:hypothetical protein